MSVREIVRASVIEDNGSFCKNVAYELTAHEHKFRRALFNALSHGEVVPDMPVPRYYVGDGGHFGRIHFWVPRDLQPLALHRLLLAIMGKALPRLAEEFPKPSIIAGEKGQVFIENYRLLFEFSLMWQLQGSKDEASLIDHASFMERYDLANYERVFALGVEPAVYH